MPKSRPPYSPEFRRQMVDLVLSGRDPDELAREFEPTGQSIRACVAKASQKEGRQGDTAVALAAPDCAGRSFRHRRPIVIAT
jgi:transposase-like protein